jgi:hypothetical protein
MAKIFYPADGDDTFRKRSDMVTKNVGNHLQDCITLQCTLSPQYPTLNKEAIYSFETLVITLQPRSPYPASYYLLCVLLRRSSLFTIRED